VSDKSAPTYLISGVPRDAAEDVLGSPSNGVDRGLESGSVVVGRHDEAIEVQTWCEGILF
jgi:hypothetical protein